MTEEFISLLGPEWKKELADLKAELADAARMIVEFNKSAKIGELNLVNAKGIGDAIQKAKELEAAQKALQQAAEKAAVKGAEVRAKEVEGARKAAAALEKQRLEELRLQKQREQAFDRYEKKLAKEQAAKDKAARQAQAASEAEDRAVKKLENDYELLKVAYNEAAAKAKSYGVTLGTSSEQFKQASAEALKMHKILLAVETAVGQNQRNVGNYTGALSSFRMNFQQVARELPSLANGFQTFAMAIGNNVPYLVDSFRNLKEQQIAARAEGQKTIPIWKTLAGAIFSWQSALLVVLTLLPMLPKLLKNTKDAAGDAARASVDFTEKQKLLHKALGEGSSELANAISLVERLRKNIDLAKNGFIDKDKVVRDFNATLGQTVGEVKNLDEAEKSLNRNAEAYIQMMLYKTAATAALREAADNYVKSLREQFAGEQQNEKIDENAAMANPNAVVVGGSPVSAAKSFNSQAAAQRAKPFQEAGDQYAELYRKLSDKVGEIAKKYNFDIFGGKREPKKAPKPTDYTNEELAVEQRIAEAQAKLRASQIQQDMEANKLIYEDETQSYQDRLLAAENFNSDRLYQLEALKAGEIGKTQAALDKIAQIEGKSAGNRTKEEKGLLLRKGEFEAEKQEITERYAAEEEKANREAQQRITALFDAEYSKRKAALTANLAENSERISEQVATELEILAQRYAKGNMTESTYRAEAARIRNNYHVLELQDQLALVDAEIANRKKYLKDAADLEKQAADIRKKINEEASKANIAALEMEAEARRALYTQIGQLARSVGDAVVSAIDAGYQRQMDQLEARKKGIQSALEVELAAIEATTVAGVAREEKIAIAKAQAADKEKQIDAEREAIENRRKDLNRIVQAAAITGQAIQTGVTLSAKAAEATAQAALLAANPLTAAYAPVALAAAGTISAQIPIVAGIAAAQIAALYAYKHGTDDHPVDSLAIVGDGFRKEVVQTPDGKTYLTPDRPTITFLEKHTKVFPSVEDYMQRHQLQSMAGAVLIPLPAPSVDVSGIRADLQNQTATLTKAIRAQRPVILKGHNPRFDTYYQRARA